MGKPKRRYNVVYVLALCFGLCVLSLTLFCPFRQAYAQSIIASVDEGHIYPCNLDRIDLYFGHNVAATDIIEQNKNHIWVEDENGVVIAGGSSVWSPYTGSGAPDADNPDTNGDRQHLYIDIQLLPDTGYTLVVTPGIVSQGNNIYDGLQVSFRSDGEKPKPTPEPAVPENSGDGGQGGMAGSNTYGDGSDLGGSSNAASGDNAFETGACASETSPADNSPKYASEAIPADNSPKTANAQNGAEIAPSNSAAENNSSSMQSKAFGAGGGVCYVVGADKSKPDNIEQEPLADDSVSLRFLVPVFGLMIVACAVFGALRRLVIWRRQINLS